MSSDPFGERKYHICLFSVLGFVAFVIAATFLNPTVRYVILCLMAAGIWTALQIDGADMGGKYYSVASRKACNLFQMFATVNAIGNFNSVYGNTS